MGVIGDLNPAPEVPLLPEPHDPVTVPGNYFVLDFASGQQGMAFFALAASNLIWMAVAVYYCCLFKQGKATYSKVAQSRRTSASTPELKEGILSVVCMKPNRSQ